MSFLNTKIVEFENDAFHNGEFIKVSNKDLANKWAVIFFYPADFTFVCPTELKDLADNYDAFKKLGVEIYSVSCDTHFVHKAWHDVSESIKPIKFPMLGDPAAKLARAFNVFNEDSGLSNRGTFLINPAGEIVLFEVSADGIGRDAQELLRKIEAAQFVAKHGNEVCPAKWKKGAKTIPTTIDQVGTI